MNQTKKIKKAAVLGKGKADNNYIDDIVPVLDVQKVKEKLNESIGSVNFMYGAEDATYDIAGRTLQDAKTDLTDILGVPKDAVALVNGEPVSEGYVLQANDDVQFIKQSGSKGYKKLKIFNFWAISSLIMVFRSSGWRTF